jgi:hypothetical protein
MRITVIDVIRAKGIEPTPDLTWSVGMRVRDLYEMRTGELPPKVLRNKTDGSGGTHCFAVYDSSWWPVIEGVVDAHVTFKARQLSLF